MCVSICGFLLQFYFFIFSIISFCSSQKTSFYASFCLSYLDVSCLSDVIQHPMNKSWKEPRLFRGVNLGLVGWLGSNAHRWVQAGSAESRLKICSSLSINRRIEMRWPAVLREGAEGGDRCWALSSALSTTRLLPLTCTIISSYAKQQPLHNEQKKKKHSCTNERHLMWFWRECHLKRYWS